MKLFFGHVEGESEGTHTSTYGGGSAAWRGILGKAEGEAHGFMRRVEGEACAALRCGGGRRVGTRASHGGESAAWRGKLGSEEG